jgi:2-hydroxymuconate-semialdehyde hydrolase
LAPFTQLRVDTLIGLLDALQLERATVMGNSMGGVWSLAIALQALHATRDPA